MYATTKMAEKRKCREFGKYGENDNFATIGNKAKHKTVKGA